MTEKDYVAVVGSTHLVTSAGAAGYLLSMQGRGLISKLSGPNSHGFEFSIYSDVMEDETTFQLYFGKDQALFDLCYNALTKRDADFVKNGGDLDAPRNHPNIPPARVLLGGISAYRAEVVDDAGVKKELEGFRNQFTKFDIHRYSSSFDDSDVKPFKFMQI